MARHAGRGSPARESRCESASPAAATRSRARRACAEESVMPTHLDAVVLGGVDGEAAPAAADVEHALALLKAELGGHEVELGELRFLEGLGAAREERAAVGHRVVEEEREELVADVVVVADGVGVAGDAVPLAVEAQLEARRLGDAGRQRGHRGARHQAQPVGERESPAAPSRRRRGTRRRGRRRSASPRRRRERGRGRRASAGSGRAPRDAVPRTSAPRASWPRRRRRPRSGRRTDARGAP